MSEISDVGRTVLSVARWSRARPMFTYSASIVLFAVALVLRFWLADSLPSGFPFLTFFPAILFAALIGGIGPGSLCAALSISASWFFFIPPYYSFQLNSASAIAVAFFSFIAAVDIYVIDLVVKAGEQLHAANDRSARLASQRSALFHELQHRVANNLTLVSAMAAVRARDVRHGHDAIAAFEDLQQRLTSLATVHRALHDPASVESAFASHFPRLAELHLKTLGADRVELHFTFDRGINLSLEQSIAIATIGLELLTNAAKHAYDPVAARTIEVALIREQDGYSLFSVRDFGRGLLAQGIDGTQQRLGMRIMKDLARSINGLLEIANAEPSGVRATVRFPTSAVPNPVRDHFIQTDVAR